MKKRTEFTKKLYAYLIEQGYSHIYSMGIRPKAGELEENEDYILIPIKSDDPRFQYQETDMHIEEIRNPDIIEMLEGDEFISFFIEMPMEEYDLFYLANKE